MPASRRRSVVLPAPSGPMRAVMLPAGICSETFLSASLRAAPLPKDLLRFLTTTASMSIRLAWMGIDCMRRIVAEWNYNGRGHPQTQMVVGVTSIDADAIDKLRA